VGGRSTPLSAGMLPAMAATMSAYICNDKTFEILTAHFISANSAGHQIPGDLKDILRKAKTDGIGATSVMRALWSMNRDAVKDRYPDCRDMWDVLPPNCSTLWNQTATDVMAYKALCRYMYQCLEGDVPESSLFKGLKRYRAELAERIVSSSVEYERAEVE
jgi:hypothetical protein